MAKDDRGEQRDALVRFVARKFPNLLGAEGRELAIAVEGLGIDAIFRSTIGLATGPRCPQLPSEFVRECWDSIDGSQFLFLDWTKLLP